MSSKYSQETIQSALKMFKDEHMTMYQIACKINASREGVRRWIQADPEVLAYKKEARELRLSGIKCKDIVELLKDKYFWTDYRMVIAWTRDCGVPTHEQAAYSYHDNKARVGWKLIQTWNRPESLHEHLLKIRKYRKLIHMYEMERCT